MEESPSEESEALMEAYRSLGLGDDLKALQDQCDRLEVTLGKTQEQLRMMDQENTRMKLQLKKDSEKQEADAQQGSSKGEVCHRGVSIPEFTNFPSQSFSVYHEFYHFVYSG